jgi:hypothetical protein
MSTHHRSFPAGKTSSNVAFVVVAALTVAISIGIAVTTSSPSESQDSKRFREAFGETTIRLSNDYLGPVSAAAKELQTLCDHVDITTSVPDDCAAFVSTAQYGQDALSVAIDELATLSRGSSVPSDARLLLTQFVGILQTTQESDRLLIQGLTNHDQESWDKGWEVRQDTASQFARLYELLSSLQGRP